MIKKQAMQVNLPGAHSAKPVDATQAVAVTVTREGKVYWNKEELKLEALLPRFEALAADPDAKVFIHGDKEADFGIVVGVLDTARKAGVRKTAIRTGASKNGPTTRQK